MCSAGPEGILRGRRGLVRSGASSTIFAVSAPPVGVVGAPAGEKGQEVGGVFAFAGKATAAAAGKKGGTGAAVKSRGTRAVGEASEARLSHLVGPPRPA